MLPCILSAHDISQAQRVRLASQQLADAPGRQVEQPVEHRPVERLALGVALDFDDAADAVHYQVHVHLGARVLVVAQIEQRLAIHHANADRGHGRQQRARRRSAGRDQLAHGQRQRQIAARHRGSARAAIRLQHVAVYDDLPRAQQGQAHSLPKAPADQPADFLGAGRGGRLARGAGVRAARQHAVFRGDPPAARSVLQHPRRQPVIHRGIAQHDRAALGDEHRAFGVVGVVQFQLDLPQFVGATAICSHEVAAFLEIVGAIVPPVGTESNTR